MYLVSGRHKPQPRYARLATACAALVLTILFVQLSLACASGTATLTGRRGQDAAQASQQGRQETREVKSNGSKAARSSSPNDDNVNVSWSTDSQRVQVNARNVALSDDALSIKAIRDGGSLFIAEKSGGNTRELKVGPGANGNLSYAYSVRGQQHEFDAEAQTWLGQILLAFVRNSGYAADQRVSWILKQQGPGGVLDEVSSITSDNIKRTYLQKLAERGNLDSANLTRVIERARQEVTSDYELTEFLLAIKGQFNMSSDVKAAFLKAVNRLQSESDRGKVLSAVAIAQ